METTQRADSELTIWIDETDIGSLSEHTIPSIPPPPPKRRVLRRLVLMGFVCAGVAAGLLALLDEGAAKPPTYRTDAVSRGSVKLAIAASGQVLPLVSASVPGSTDGTAAAVLAEVGSTVKEGDILARLEASAPAADLEAARIGLENAQAALELARTMERNSLALKAKGLIPATEVDQAVAERKQAEGQLKIARTGVSKANLAVSRCTVRAPIDGIVIARNLELGQAVRPGAGTAPLFVIAGGFERMRIDAPIVEADIGRVKIGQDVKFTVDAFPEEEFKGKVTGLAEMPTTDQTVVSYPVMIEADNDSGILKPGMTANLSIVVEEREDVLRVPNAALRFRPTVAADGGTRVAGVALAADSGDLRRDEETRGPTVYRLRPASGAGGSPTLEPVTVEVGLADAKRTEVTGALEVGDEVVTEMEEPERSSGFFSRVSSLLAGNPKASVKQQDGSTTKQDKADKKDKKEKKDKKSKQDASADGGA